MNKAVHIICPLILLISLALISQSFPDHQWRITRSRFFNPNRITRNHPALAKLEGMKEKYWSPCVLGWFDCEPQYFGGRTNFKGIVPNTRVNIAQESQEDVENTEIR